MLTRKQAVEFLARTPYKLGHLVGFTKLTELHNKWAVDMIKGKGDKTLLAHRGSFKTTTVSIALAVIMVLFPNEKILFLRKTDNDTKEIVAQVKKILLSPQMRYIVQCIYGLDLYLTTDNANELSTNLCNDIRGSAQLVAMGCGASITGKHYERIFTDDIVNKKDRFSKAERDNTKITYQELQNLKNRGGRIYNTGTPWHKEDAFSIMPPAEKYDCYSTGLISAEEIEQLKSSMLSSLFAANYELKHIASEDVIFSNPKTNGDITKIEQGEGHIDAAYGGSDYTAYTLMQSDGENIYVYGRLWQKSVDDVEDEILKIHSSFNGGRIYCEDNGDKGYLAKSLRRKGARVNLYHENMNKFVKITTYLKSEWNCVIFVTGTDEEYINQICDYNENAEHDDAPDSLSSIIRKKWNRLNQSEEEYKPIWN